MPRSLKRLGSSLLIGGQAVTATMRGRINTVDLSDQLMEAGPGSLLIVFIISVAAGSVFNIQVAAELTRQGAGSTVGGILAIGLAREIAPLLTACLLAGKVATAYAAQLGTMKVTEQIDAITMLRTDPVEYLVVPRLIALVVMAPLQCFFFFIDYFDITLQRIHGNFSFGKNRSDACISILHVRCGVTLKSQHVVPIKNIICSSMF